ncbi:MAG: hypothetical protein ACKO37_00070 [Vampirovibrionales bacterium]
MMNTIGRLIPAANTQKTAKTAQNTQKATTVSPETLKQFKPYSELSSKHPVFSNKSFFQSDLGNTNSVSALDTMSNTNANQPITPKAVNTDTLFKDYGYKAVVKGKVAEPPPLEQQPTLSTDVLSELKTIAQNNLGMKEKDGNEKAPLITTHHKTGHIAITVPKTENGKGGYIIDVSPDGKMTLRANDKTKDGFVTKLPQADAESILADTVTRLSKRSDFKA